MPFHATSSSGYPGIHCKPCGVPSLNSEERRAARRKRREEKRLAKRKERQEALTLEAIASTDSLHKSAMLARKRVSWKASVQRYMKDELRNIRKANHQLMNGEDVRRGFYEFDIYERGKLRHIQSVHISERVIQKSLSQTILVPALTNSFIRNNTANTKGRGLHDALKRLVMDLSRYYRKHGADGYILLCDFSNYFGSINHDYLKGIISKEIDDRRVCSLEASFIDANGSIGLGLGSEPNQICAVAFPNRLDHFITECCGIEGYGRYNDDFYCIAPDKETLHACLALIKDKCASMGLELHGQKTRIVRLSKGFTWLKKRISYGQNGKIVIRPSKDSIARERRKLKKQAAMVREGGMELDQLECSYQSWRGSLKGLDAHESIVAMDRLYKELTS